MTWDELKLNVLMEMGDATVLANADADTVARMPTVANAGLYRLATIAKANRKTVSFAQTSYNDNNLLGDSFETVKVLDEDVVLQGIGGKAYYFEVNNPCTVYIKVNGAIVETITNTAEGVFTAKSGTIANTSGVAEICFVAGYPYAYRNACIYDVTFDDVPVYERYHLLDIEDYVTDTVYAINSVTLDDDFRDYSIVQGKKLRMGSDYSGNIAVEYFALPTKITPSTTGTTAIDCTEEAAQLLVYFMCYHLYKGDDSYMATQWHNDFEEGIGTILRNETSATVISSDRGWF